MDEKQKALHLLAEIEKYETVPEQAPFPVISQLVKTISPKLSAIGIMTIGGESVVIKTNNTIGEIIVLKIARKNFQAFEHQDIETKQNPLAKFFAKKKKNVSATRFREGVKIQLQLAKEIEEKQITSFHIQKVIDYSEIPIRHVELEHIDAEKVINFLAEKQDMSISLKAYISLLRCIDFAHARGIIHRDIKSDNILGWRYDRKTKNLTVAMLDWTLSKMIGQRDLTLPGQCRAGSIGYSTQKMLRDGDFANSNYLDDIFCLGIVFWEFIKAQKLEIPDPNIYTDDAKMKNYLSSLKSVLPIPAQKIFEKATNISEDKRYQSISEISSDIQVLFHEFKIVDQETKQQQQQQVNNISVIVDITDIEQELLTLAQECDNCGSCKGNFPCRKFRTEIAKYIWQCKQKGII